MTSVQWCIIAMLALLLPSLAFAQRGSSYATEVVRTDEGNFQMVHRSPAGAGDVRIPILAGGKVEESFAYRVRDRKLRDLLFLARIRMAYTRPANEVKLFYLGALGLGAAEETDVTTGVITMTSGEQDHFRLVIITPKEQGCTVQLERVQQFTIPPRVYTEAEQRVIRVLDDVASRYRTSKIVNYTMKQRGVLPGVAAENQPPALIWTVAFTRPAKLSVSTSAGEGSVGMRITTENGALHVHQPGVEHEHDHEGDAADVPKMVPMEAGDDIREIVGGYIAINDVPEMRDDPVARLMFGATLLTDQLDYLTMQTVADVPAGQQAEIILTYPDRNEALHLFIDLKQKTILRSVTVLTREDRKIKMYRIYSDMTLDPLPEERSADTTPQPASPPATPAVVRP